MSSGCCHCMVVEPGNPCRFCLPVHAQECFSASGFDPAALFNNRAETPKSLMPPPSFLVSTREDVLTSAGLAKILEALMMRDPRVAGDSGPLPADSRADASSVLSVTQYGESFVSPSWTSRFQRPYTAQTVPVPIALATVGDGISPYGASYCGYTRCFALFTVRHGCCGFASVCRAGCIIRRLVYKLWMLHWEYQPMGMQSAVRRVFRTALEQRVPELRARSDVPIAPVAEGLVAARKQAEQEVILRRQEALCLRIEAAEAHNERVRQQLAETERQLVQRQDEQVPFESAEAPAPDGGVLLLTDGVAAGPGTTDRQSSRRNTTTVSLSGGASSRRISSSNTSATAVALMRRQSTRRRQSKRSHFTSGSTLHEPDVEAPREAYVLLVTAVAIGARIADQRCCVSCCTCRDVDIGSPRSQLSPISKYATAGLKRTEVLRKELRRHLYRAPVKPPDAFSASRRSTKHRVTTISATHVRASDSESTASPRILVAGMPSAESSRAALVPAGGRLSLPASPGNRSTSESESLFPDIVPPQLPIAVSPLHSQQSLPGVCG